MTRTRQNVYQTLSSAGLVFVMSAQGNSQSDTTKARPYQFGIDTETCYIGNRSVSYTGNVPFTSAISQAITKDITQL